MAEMLLLYLTYEGLKLKKSYLKHYHYCNFSLYLTYEGLKPFYSFAGFYNPHSE